jgi:hemin uptake protein HemP
MPGKPAKEPVAVRPIKRIAVSEILSGRRQAILLHGGTEYHLRLTSNGKLLLTK